MYLLAEIPKLLNTQFSTVQLYDNTSGSTIRFVGIRTRRDHLQLRFPDFVFVFAIYEKWRDEVYTVKSGK